MTADLGPELTWALGALILLGVAAGTVLLVTLLEYTRWVSILLVCLIGVAVVPYAIGWAFLRLPVIEVNDP